MTPQEEVPAVCCPHHRDQGTSMPESSNTKTTRTRLDMPMTLGECISEWLDLRETA